MTSLQTIPTVVHQASDEDIVWGVDVSSVLVGSQTVTVVHVALVDLGRSQPQIGLAYSPTLSGTVISQRIPAGLLIPTHTYRLVFSFTPSGTTDIKDVVLGIICPFGLTAGGGPPAPRSGYLLAANNGSDFANIETVLVNLGLGNVISDVAALTTAVDNGFNPTVTPGSGSSGPTVSLPLPQWAISGSGVPYYLNGNPVPSGYFPASLGPDLTLYPIGGPA